MVDKIELHKTTGEIVFSYLLRSTLSNDKLKENLQSWSIK